MKKELHLSKDRGTSELDWLHSRFSFSFARYHNPHRMGFGKLVVINDDIIEPDKGFPSHPHENMEIITIPIEGELIHKDSTGVEEIIIPGEIQVMSAGTGIVHSEFNHSKSRKLKLFQIWIETNKQNLKPRHDKKKFDIFENKLNLVVSGKKDKNSLFINQNAIITLGKFDKGKGVEYKILSRNGVFIFVIDGNIEVLGDELKSRDAIAISEVKSVDIKILEKSYFMIVDIPLK